MVILVSTSRRTTRPNLLRRRRTDSIASRRSSASSSSSKSASRVTRNGWCASTSIPGNSAPSLAAMTCSSSTKRSPSGSATKRGSSGGTFTRAKRSSPLDGSRTVTARFSDRFEMYGKGCAGSTARGVSTGKISSRKSASRWARSSSDSSSQSAKRIPVSSSAGVTSLANTAAERATSCSTRSRMARSWSTRSRPSGVVVRRPGRELLHEAGHPDLEELVEVLAEDGEELGPLEQRQLGVLGEREHAGVELEPRELAVEEAFRGVRQRGPGAVGVPRSFPGPVRGGIECDVQPGHRAMLLGRSGRRTGPKVPGPRANVCEGNEH